MKKTGFTIIEVVIAIAILAIIFSITGISIKSFNKVYEDVGINQALYEIEDMLSYGEIYFRNIKKDGIFIVEQNEESITIILKERTGHIVKKVDLPKVISLIGEINQFRELKVTSEGRIQSDTIKFIGNDGKVYSLTIRVSVNLITIWEWNVGYG